MIILNSWKYIYKYYIPYLPIDHFKSYTLVLETVWCAGDRPSHPLCTPVVWSGEPYTAAWWWSKPEQRCCGATESCPCEAQKTLLWLKQICIVQCVFMVLRYFTRPDVTHKLLDLLCANISQCCSSKVFRTVSCRNNETRQTARHFNFQTTWGKTPPLLSEATMKQCHF